MRKKELGLKGINSKPGGQEGEGAKRGLTVEKKTKADLNVDVRRRGHAAAGLLYGYSTVGRYASDFLLLRERGGH